MITYRVNFNEVLADQDFFIPSSIEFTHEAVEKYEGEYTIHPNAQSAFEACLQNSLAVGAWDIVADEKEDISHKTLEDGETLSIMQNSQGFWYCINGTEKGNYWESDDIGPFRTQAEAQNDVPEYFVRLNEAQ